MADPSPKSDDQSNSGFRPLRAWPALLLIAAMLVLRYLPNLIPNPPDSVLETLAMTQAMGPAFCAILILVWWLTFSQARWFERIVGAIGIVLALFSTNFILDQSMVGVGTMYLTIPMGLAGFGIGVAIFRQTLSFKRTVMALALTMVLVGFSALLRNEGMTSDARVNLHWRWTPTNEEILVQAKQIEPNSEIVVSGEYVAALANPEWAGFRGADRTGRQRGSVIRGQWAQTPEEIWKIAIGPGWSSFSVAGDLIFTQEQRGESEAVVCYEANSGKEVWIYEVKTRFEEAIGGAGPRGTPTLATLTSAGDAGVPSLFAMGANGALVRLDPTTGEKLWQQELQTVANREPPTWGFSSSPLVVDSNVIVHAGGPDDKGTLAFDVETGDLVWSAKSGDHSYSSPQLCSLLDEELVLVVSNNGLEILDPSDGSMRLDYQWKCSGYRSLQPHVSNGNLVVLPTGTGTGTRRIELTKSEGSNELVAKSLWTSMQLKPDFNDFVEFDGHLYGFDGSIFTCINLETGERAWKGGRYGKGQVLLLEDSALLLVASEKGEVVMLEASPLGHIELDRFQAIDGKTWNHPVVVGDRLFIRNAEEAACFRLPIAEESQ